VVVIAIDEVCCGFVVVDLIVVGVVVVVVVCACVASFSFDAFNLKRVEENLKGRN
jgi:hypothetical protein